MNESTLVIREITNLLLEIHEHGLQLAHFMWGKSPLSRAPEVTRDTYEDGYGYVRVQGKNAEGVVRIKRGLSRAKSNSGGEIARNEAGEESSISYKYAKIEQGFLRQ